MHPWHDKGVRFLGRIDSCHIIDRCRGLYDEKRAIEESLVK
jgi:hypothetical protein